MAHPGTSTGDIYSGSGLKAYLDKQRAHALAGADAYLTVAWELQRAVERMGSSILGGRMADPRNKLNARRLVRPLRHASAIAEDQARMFSLVWQIHNGIFVPEAKTGTGGNTYRPGS